MTSEPSPALASSSSAYAEPFAELVPGAHIAFKISTNRVHATVLHVYRPFTMSAVLRVRVVEAHGTALAPGSEAILKLYNRRFLNNVREELDPPAPWSPELDRAYAQWLRDVADGKAQAVDFDDDTGSVWTYENLSVGSLEAYLQRLALRMHSRELHAYDVLEDLQGDLIPRLYGSVTYDSHDTSTPRAAVPGILIEHIPGPTMRELVATWTARTPSPPDAQLAKICDAAVDAVEQVAQCDALINPDVRVDNVIFRGFDDTPGRSPVVVIDFTEVFTRDGESDEEWRQTKVDNDEVGAIGKALTVKVATQVGLGIWTFHRILPITAAQLRK